MTVREMFAAAVVIAAMHLASLRARFPNTATIANGLFTLRLEAQRALGFVKIERNTAKVLDGG